MEEMVDQGLTKTIGICNFSTQLLRQLLSTSRIRPSTLQIELHPQNSQQNLLRFAHEAVEGRSCNASQWVLSTNRNVDALQP